MNLRVCLLLATLFSLVPKSWAQTDSIAPVYPYTNPTAQTLSRIVPLIGIGTLYNFNNKNVALLRSRTMPQAHTRLDDYAQFSPLALQASLRLAGVKGRSKSTLEMLSADALSGAIMMSLVSLGKYTTHVERPDGSAHNSFPSGHTAMAFASARMLDLEYGHKYPWLARLGYATAMGVGLGRMVNNRHWLGDVVTGAFVGMLSSELGYWLNDKLWRRGTYHTSIDREMTSRGTHIILPWSISIGDNKRWIYTGVGLRHELAWARLVGQVELGVNLLEIQEAQSNPRYTQDSQIKFAIGKAWGLGLPSISVDTMLGVHLRPSDKASPFVQISPRWQMTRGIGVHLDLSYTYDQGALRIAQQASGATYHSRPRWSIGSTLDIRL